MWVRRHGTVYTIMCMKCLHSFNVNLNWLKWPLCLTQTAEIKISCHRQSNFHITSFVTFMTHLVLFFFLTIQYNKYLLAMRFVWLNPNLGVIYFSLWCINFYRIEQHSSQWDIFSAIIFRISIGFPPFVISIISKSI